jgi:serine/threonine protein kinase
MKTATPSAQDDPRVLQAARDYLAELEAGRKPDRQAYLLRCPELADALAVCLDGVQLAHAAAGALAPLAPPALPEHSASPLGDFQIVREVGRGGMGVVYEAVQLSLGRTVALKVLPFAAALDAKHLQRFKTEAHAAAGLHHTNIVPVYAVGCERGVHFYAMQLIHGRSLEAVIQELRGEAGEDHPLAPATTVAFRAGPTAGGSAPVRTSQRSNRGREGFRTAARLGSQVADALEYAHEAGVVHRDVKPANLLLDAKGNAWVTDFGLAQVSADISLTRTGDMVGTLRYMSPEQASGQRVLVDHRTDVYSLGATLYELLTLQPIFDGQDRRTVLRQILDEEPRPLRQIDRAIPVELETIVLKAVAKAPEERYATAGEMAADLRRFLEEQPILARRPTLVERTRKWMRRHPSFAGAALLVMVFVVCGLATTTALVAREQGRTRAAYHQERLRAEEAEERFRLARRAADELIQVAQEELADKPHLESLRKRLLEAALVYYQELIEYRREDPDAKAELELTRDQVQKIVRDLAVLQGMGRIALLENEAVREDLRASAEQCDRLAELSTRLASQRQELFTPFHRLKPEEWRKRFLAAAHANEAAVRSILRPRQISRLGQIALQVRGLAAFQEPEVVAALKLTVSQRERIRGIEAGLFFSNWGRAAQGGPPKGPGAAKGHKSGKGRFGHFGGPSRKIDEKALKAAHAKALAVLNKDQLNRWGRMVGEPFTGAASLRPHGPSCPPGPR